MLPLLSILRNCRARRTRVCAANLQALMHSIRHVCPSSSLVPVRRANIIVINQKIHRIGAGIQTKDSEVLKNYASGEYDLSDKTAMKRVITLRKSYMNHYKRSTLAQIKLKCIDTSSKMDHGRFQTPADKLVFMGPLKEEQVATTGAPATCITV